MRTSFAGSGFDGEERGRVGQAARTVGGGGEVDGGNGADEGGTIEDFAVEQVVDVLFVFVERDALVGDDFQAGEGFGQGDGIDALKGEHDAALVAADGHPVIGDGDDACLFRGACELRLGEVGGAALELVGEVGKKLGQHLALAALRTQNEGQGRPLVGHAASLLRGLRRGC